jgi:hypothetical protein
MCAGTGFHPDQAAWNVAQPTCELMSGYLLLKNDHAALVEPHQMEGVFADVDPECADSCQ